jgi:hypothetical protein
VVEYLVDHTSIGWAVNRDGRVCGTFPDAMAAIRAAIHAAHYAGVTESTGARVMIAGGGGQAEAWRFGDRLT